eukprot:Plantae.Rhodophyta-Purpureofilum_apyrenoidigerum.ctg15365.p1 GENE.Plantae.Rhodophyta-Purpureofilum_apyrenoidigerum.ctg15365~~Plantae.Rhodophyta-Purpureofilum_apyrenoidigerum.ctg15365.p1  ORF type:complete len:700 (-),score=147.45 Plantae.Rhodophyta-Purpureofilum_apyrenoidigerum.ctg15365:588-2687(-)
MRIGPVQRLMRAKTISMTENAPRLLNSFTKSKDVLRTIEPNALRWYICGPTVYDSAHMGHARNYVNFDIVRRVMSDYFGYNVTYVMNVTDIDDKIIIRTHQLRLKEVLARAEALQAENDLVQRAKTILQGKADNLSEVQELHEGLTALVRQKEEIADFCIQDNFSALAKKYEAEFFEDMKSLGVRVPDVITRVSEYVPETVDFIKGVLDNNFAYESGGSVYFDTAAFMSSEGKQYGKLKPSAVGQENLITEGEGALSATGEKRSNSDFVLWKKSKPGEPVWESPWGQGRPGWHVECSAMCSDILGSTVDINCGGVDLAFPHHENQLAQSEAYWDCPQWVNYFLHSGHLHIDGLKMSKSLKNFITIQQALQLYTARQVRLLFLMQLWTDPMELTPQLLDDGSGLKGFTQMEQAVSAEATFAEFFHKVKALIRSGQGDYMRTTKWNQEEKEFHAEFLRLCNSVDNALRDSVDTPTVVKTLLEIVRKTNSYVGSANPMDVRVHLVTTCARYVTKILKILGVSAGDEDIGMGGAGAGDGVNAEEVLGPHLDAWVSFREDLRKLAKSDDFSAKAVLQACDRIRDEKLPELGVKIDDSGSSGVWKLYDPEELRKQTQLESDAKQARVAAALQLQAERDRKASIPANEMFKVGEYEGKFLTYDDEGIPLKDSLGEDVTKNARKKLLKLHKVQSSAHAAWQQRQNAS